MARNLLDRQLKIDNRQHVTQKKLLTGLQAAYDRGTPFEQLTVSALCTQSNVSRATFYRHHQDIGDIIAIQFLIVMRTFDQQIDALSVLSFESASNVVVRLILDNRALFQLVIWSNTADRVQDILSGTALQVLMARDFTETTRTFISTFLGREILNFSLQVTEAPTPLSFDQTRRLYQLLMPRELE
ncbi:hypothetical protein [Secundilactobacillus paracollinoides]|uniref:hypothetical protein n=1 Tax=Secundilactobacillus paracollinoides TaxID=240427 RepID=UPI0006F0D261|nr:hypothetical protein [Secundilactobacillus paracollinoides]KRL80808.1 hypothetical protein FC17_GL003183 [Secundilactobacillus paracollinoides DSM 15502 = JCM 11969]